MKYYYNNTKNSGKSSILLIYYACVGPLMTKRLPQLYETRKCKCGSSFVTEVYSWTKKVEYIRRDKQGKIIESWIGDKEYTRPQSAKCDLCKNVKKACNYFNKVLLSN